MGNKKRKKRKDKRKKKTMQSSNEKENGAERVSERRLKGAHVQYSVTRMRQKRFPATKSIAFRPSLARANNPAGWLLRPNGGKTAGPLVAAGWWGTKKAVNGVCALRAVPAQRVGRKTGWSRNE